MQKTTNTGPIVGLALAPLAVSHVALDQFPTWFTKIAVAGLAVAPVGVVVAQILMVLARGWGCLKPVRPTSSLAR